MDNADPKDQPGLTKVEDLDRVVRVRKYQHCAAEYLKLAKEPNTMQVVADRYLRIAAYYSELADNEDTEDANEGDAKLVDAALQLVSQEVPARASGHRDEIGKPTRPRLRIERAREERPQGRHSLGCQANRFAPAALGSDETRPALVEVERRLRIERPAASGAFRG